MRPFTFDEEQEELRRTLRSLLAKQSDSERVRRAADTEGGVDDALWRQLAGQVGVAGLMIPEEYGGAGYGFVEAALVAEELGRVLACVPYLSSSVLAASVLLEAGTEEAKAELLPGLASGEVRATVALLEEGTGWDPAAVALTVEEEGSVLPPATTNRGTSDLRLTGTKRFVLDGTTADLLLVVARHGAGLSVLAVPQDADGVTTTPLTTLDTTRAQADVVLDRAPARLVSEAGGAAAGLERALEVAAAAVCAESVGAAQKCLEMTVEYARTRHQFGRLIGSYQAISHKCADMLAAVELSRSTAQYAAWAVAHADHDERAVAVATAKAFVADAFQQVAGDTIQVHGGIGFTWEHDAHLYFKRAKTNGQLFGDATESRRRLGDLIKL